MTDESCINNIVYFCSGTPLPKSFPLKKLEDEEFLLKAIEARPFLATQLNKFVPERILNDDNFVRKAATINGMALAYASNDLIVDEDFVISVIKNTPRALKYALHYLQDNKNLVLELVKKDKTVVMAAIQQFGCSFQYASETLLKDPELMDMAATVIASSTINLGDSPLFKRKDFALLLLSKNPSKFLLLDKELQSDREIALTVTMLSPYHYHYLNATLKEDLEIAAYAYLGSRNTKLSIPRKFLDSKEFYEQVAIAKKKKREAEKQQTASKKPEEKADLPKFLINKDKANPSMYSISLDWHNKKETLSPQIEIKNRFILSIDDYVQPKKNVAFFRYMIPNYGNEIKEIYDSLSSEVKELIPYEKFFKDMKKRLMSKEVDTYREIRFAFRKFDDCVKVFTYYNPYERTSVITYMGFRMASPRAWYVKDLAEGMKEIKDFKEKDLSSLRGFESRATDDAVYYELEEMNYCVLIEEVDQQKAKEDPINFVNTLVNTILKENEEEEKEPVNVFDIRDYESVVQFDDRLGLPSQFEKALIKALENAR